MTDLVENVEALKRMSLYDTESRTQALILHLWYDNCLIEVDNSEDQKCDSYDKNASGFKALTRCAMLCSLAEFKLDDDNLKKPVLQRECVGNVPDSALLRFCELSFGNVTQFKEKNKKVFDIPYNNTNRYKLSIHETNDGDERYLLVMKGAPERILEHCSHIYVNGSDLELTDLWKDEINKSYYNLGEMGENILAFCDVRLDSKIYPRGFNFNADEINFQTDNLRYLGLASMLVVPRVLVCDSAKKCRSAGIKVCMITGDNIITAKARAKYAGIISKDSETVEDIAKRLNVPVNQVDSKDAKACVLHGFDDLINMSPQDIENVFKNHDEIVFGRISPELTLTIVDACQRTDSIVAFYFC